MNKKVKKNFEKTMKFIKYSPHLKYLLTIFFICAFFNCDDNNITNPEINNSSKIAYVSTRGENYGENPGIYLMNIDGSNKEQIYSYSGYISNLSWHPDGTKLLFTQFWDIHILNLIDFSIMKLTNTSDNISPAWSPDGSKIAFSSLRDNNPSPSDNGYDVFLMNADGSNQINLTNNPASDANPSWSPDGSKITFSSWRDGVNIDEIYIMNVDGSEQTRLTNNSYADRYPAWSPDGSKIAFTSYENVSPEIFIMNSDGSGRKRLTFLSSGYWPSWSPDGSMMVFISDYDERLKNTNAESWSYDVYTMSVDGSNISNLTNTSWFEYVPHWSPNSK